jgi:CheY-like chemotaxis protein
MSEAFPRVVLLVEDDPDHAELVARAVAAGAAPVHLVHVNEGREALSYLARTGPWADAEKSPRPDLVLLDLRLHGMNGSEVLRQIKVDPALREIPVVVLSTSEADLSPAEDEQAEACAVKPIDGETFRELVQQLVSSWMPGKASSA